MYIYIRSMRLKRKSVHLQRKPHEKNIFLNPCGLRAGLVLRSSGSVSGGGVCSSGEWDWHTWAPLHLLVLKINRNVYRVDFYSQFWQFTHVEALNHPIFRPWMKTWNTRVACCNWCNYPTSFKEYSAMVCPNGFASKVWCHVGTMDLWL